jgi:hypothetical protein
MLVPKATVNKNDLLLGWKNEIRAAGQISTMYAEAKAQTMRQ